MSESHENALNEISVIVDNAEKKRSSRDGALGGVLKSSGAGSVKIKTEKLQQSFSALSGQISAILKDVKTVGDFKLQQVQLSVEISAEGGVSLIGSVKAGTKGAVTLTFGV